MNLPIILLLFSLHYIKPENVTIHLPFEDHENYFYRDSITSAQVLVTSLSASLKIPTRLLIAFPAGNSGAAIYLNPTSAPRLIISLVGNVVFSYKDGKQVGITGQISLDSRGYIDFAMLGSIRGIRNYVEGQKKNEEMMPSPNLRTPTSASFTYSFRDGVTTEVFKIESVNKQLIKISENKVHLPFGKYNFYATLNFPVLTPMNETQLLREDKHYLFKNLTTRPAVQYLTFLAYKEKFLAGAWRFMTYFGRDTLISLRLLAPILSSDAIEAGLRSVFDRMKPDDGKVCHEEVIGDWASTRHPDLNLVYNMIDQDYLLLPTLSEYFLDDPIGKNRSAADYLDRYTKGLITYSKLLGWEERFLTDVSRVCKN